MPIVYDDEQAAAAPAPIVKYDEPAAPPPDKYQQAAIAERQRLTAAGVPLPEGFTRRAIAGPFMGWSDEIGAAMMTPFEMARQGTWDPREGYRYAKARETLADTETAKKTGVLGDITEIGSGIALAPGQIFARPLAAAIGGGGKGVLPALARTGAYGVESGTLGAIQGAGSAETVGDIPKEALRSGLISGAIGAPFGVAANVARRTTAAVPTEAELNLLGAGAYRARDQLPVAYNLERAVAERAEQTAQAARNTYGRDAPLTDLALNKIAGQARDDINAVAAINAGRNPQAVATRYSGQPNTAEAVATPRDIASLRRQIYDEGSGKVFTDPRTGQRVVPEIPTGSPTDELAALRASKIMQGVVSRPDPRFLSKTTNMRDAITAAMLDTRGRENFAAKFRSEAVTGAIDDALRGSGSAPFAERFKTAVNKATKSGEFDRLNDTEIAALEKVAKGAAFGNVVKNLGMKWATSGTLAGGGTYAATQDPWTAAMAAAGGAIGGPIVRGIGEKLARSKAEKFAEELRKRSPEYAARVARAPTEIGPGLASPLSGLRQALTIGDQGAMRDALARMLMYQTTGRRE
jgi:hypothetical protein